MYDDFPQGGFEPTQEPAYQNDMSSGGFEDWSSPTQDSGSFAQDSFDSPDDGWGSFKSDDQASSSPQSDGWDTSTQDDFVSSEPEQSQGSFISQEDDGWGKTSGVDYNPQPQQPIVSTDYASSEVNTPDFQPKKFNLGLKRVALIIAVLCLVLALVFLGLDKIHINKKPTSTQPSQTTPTQTSQTDTRTQDETGEQTPQTQPSTQPTNVDSVVLVEIPKDTHLDYNGDILTANGKVINKLKYVQAHQVLYCVNIGVAFGSTTETVSYYCNYSSFNAVSEGDIVVLTYQQVNDSYISILSISK